MRKLIVKAVCAVMAALLAFSVPVYADGYTDSLELYDIETGEPKHYETFDGIFIAEPDQGFEYKNGELDITITDDKGNYTKTLTLNPKGEVIRDSAPMLRTPVLYDNSSGIEPEPAPAPTPEQRQAEINKLFTEEDLGHIDRMIEIEKEIRTIEYEISDLSRVDLESNEITLNSAFLKEYEDKAVEAAQTRETSEIAKGNENIVRKIRPMMIFKLPEGETTVNVEKSFKDSKIEKVTFEVGEKELIFETMYTEDDYTVVLTADNFPTYEDDGDLTALGGGAIFASLSQSNMVPFERGRLFGPRTVKAPAKTPQSAVNVTAKTPANVSSNSSFKAGALTDSKIDPKNLTTKNSNSGANKGGKEDPNTGKTVTKIDADEAKSNTTIIQSEENFADITISNANMQGIIRTMMTKGFVNGYPDGSVRENNSITRAEFAKLLLSALGERNTYATTSSFKDVKADAWYMGDVATSEKKGYVNGYPNGTFRPKNSISNAEGYQVSGKSLKFGKEYKLNASEINNEIERFYNLNTVSDYVKENVALFIKIGKAKTSATKDFGSGNTMTRGQAIMLIYAVYEIRF